MNSILKFKNYLIEDNGYLLNNKSKVIMISGKWGCGKTHFWKDIIKDDKLKDNNIYISLYGKTTLDAIENEVFLKAYYKSIGNNENKKDIVEKLSSTFSSLTGAIDQFSDIKVSPFIDFLNKLDKNSKDSKAEIFMKEGLIICFDDFERKSTNVNLNDLFGFITNLSLQYGAMVVIILNDDIFEGKDKKSFTNLKEKSVNKFLEFEPTIDYLFGIIFDKYNIDTKYKIIILTAIKDMNVLNARIYENILENFQEYEVKNKNIADEEIRYFVLTTINFNLNHIVFKFYDYPEEQKTKVLSSNFYHFNLSIKIIHTLIQFIEQSSQHGNIKLELIELIRSSVSQKYKTIEEKDKKKEINPTEQLTFELEMINNYSEIIWSFWKLEVKLKYRDIVSEEKQKDINNFIKTGIL